MTWWSKVTQYKRSNPQATADECVVAVGVPVALRSKLKAAAYQAIRKPRNDSGKTAQQKAISAGVKAAWARKKATTAGEALSEFKATRQKLKHAGVIPGAKPFGISVDVDDRGIVIELRNEGDHFRRLAIDLNGIGFNRGADSPATDRRIPWALLETLQSFSSSGAN